jgi:hypothetical protein
MPTPLATEARTTLATNLAGVGVKVWSVAPNVPTPPCLVIKPDTVWIIPRRIGSNLNYEVRLNVLIVADGRTNAQALAKCEQLVDALLNNVGSGFTVEQIGPPQLTDLGGKGSALTVETTITAQVKE